tara:strand:- start:804 stop:1424 length:621 start_codon:yes stop_codon:yes gene_type:complete
MKKMIIPALILSLSFAFDAGTKSLGGGVNFVMDINTQEYSYDMMGYDVSVTNETTTTNFMIMPSGSYFVIDNLALGGNLSMSMVSQEMTMEVCVEDDCESDTYSSSDDPDFENPMGFGFSGAYYKGNMYGHAGFQEPDNTIDDNEYLEFGAGYLYKLTDSIFIDSKVSYRHMLGEGAPDMDDGQSVDGFTETNIKLYGTVGISVFF